MNQNKLVFTDINNIIINYYDVDTYDFSIVNNDVLNLFNNDNIIKVIIPKNCIVMVYYKKINDENSGEQQLYRYYSNYNYNNLSYISKTKNNMIIYNIYVKILSHIQRDITDFIFS